MLLKQNSNNSFNKETVIVQQKNCDYFYYFQITIKHQFQNVFNGRGKQIVQM